MSTSNLKLRLAREYIYKSGWNFGSAPLPEDLQRCLEIETVLGAELPHYIQAVSGLRNEESLQGIASRVGDKSEISWGLYAFSFIAGAIVAVLLILPHLTK